MSVKFLANVPRLSATSSTLTVPVSTESLCSFSSSGSSIDYDPSSSSSNPFLSSPTTDLAPSTPGRYLWTFRFEGAWTTAAIGARMRIYYTEFSTAPVVLDEMPAPPYGPVSGVFTSTICGASLSGTQNLGRGDSMSLGIWNDDPTTALVATGRIDLVWIAED